MSDYISLSFTGPQAEVSLCGDAHGKFWRQVQKTDACWEWTGTLSSDGYGRFYVGRRTIAAHRRSWQLHRGEIPAGLFVCHTCDNRPCVNPDHLFIGTNQDNLRDMCTKGRNRFGVTTGENNPRAKLKTAAVREIRELAAHGLTLRAIAERFHVNGTTVFAILSGRTWKHVS